MSDGKLYGLIEAAVLARSRTEAWTSSEIHAWIKRLFSAFRGLDALQPYIDDPEVTEIMVNGAAHIFVEKNGTMERADAEFESEEKLEDLIQTVVAKVNRIVNQSSPIVDARLADGSRVHVVLPPIALSGPVLTIRKFPAKPLTMQDWIAREGVSGQAAELLQLLVEAGTNIFISGGTGSGKTTLLNALAAYIPTDERIVTIEDSAELQIHTIPNLVSLETRNANTEGKGEITMRELIRASLRMRPSRIIVGEVRGAEAFDMLQAMNTGHAGSISTGHANSAADMLSRLETMVLGAAALPVEAIRRHIASAIQIVVHVSRLRDRSRRITEIQEVLGVQHGEIKLRPLFLFQEEDAPSTALVCGRLHYTGQPLQSLHRLTAAGKQLPAWCKRTEAG